MNKLKFMIISYKAVCGTVVMSNLQFDIRSVEKQWETLGGKLFKAYCLRFSQYNIAQKYMEY